MTYIQMVVVVVTCEVVSIGWLDIERCVVK